MARNVPNHLSQRQKEFINHLDQVSVKEGHARPEVFRIFLEMAYNAIKKTTVIGPAADELEAEYMRAIGRLHRQPSESSTLLAQCMGLLTLALEEEGLHDFLGPIFMETVSDPAKGQFFTPDELTYMMAEMQFSELSRILEQEDYITGHEPAGGTGGAVLAGCKSFASRKIDFSRRFIWQVIELDRSAYMGCYIQLSLAGVNAHVINGNTLTLETFDQAITPVRLMHPRPFGKREVKKVAVRSRTRPAYPAKSLSIRRRKRPAKAAK